MFFEVHLLRARLQLDMRLSVVFRDTRVVVYESSTTQNYDLYVWSMPTDGTVNKITHCWG